MRGARRVNRPKLSRRRSAWISGSEHASCDAALSRKTAPSAAGVSQWGRSISGRVALIQLADTWHDLFELRTLGLHPLHGDRAGQFAIRLTGAVRLIVERGATTAQIVVVDVEDYHG